MSNQINFNGKTIGDNSPIYFIADIGANHDGSLERAYKLIELAKKSGADAAKFQNFQAPKIVSKLGFESLTNSSHQSNWKKSVYEIYEDASISMDWTYKLKEKCNEVGIDYFTSPYDFESADHVDQFVELYKIGSGDITWIDFINYIAKKNKPILIATGASNLDDVDRAVNSILQHNNQVCLMQCNTNYTTDKNKHQFVNLNVLNTFKKRYPNLVLGLSDHTIDYTTVLGAITLGARVIEKHFTDDNNREGPDHKFAINPENWKQMVIKSKILDESLGDGIKRIEKNEENSIIVQRRGLRASNDLKKGRIIKDSDLISLRPIPSDGIPPYKKNDIVGLKLIKDIKQDDYLTFKHFEND
tara:strand:+ start:503 stop:1576 length:1074 start_codon:yes stop_codon:yes gene_type:complete